MAFTIKNVSGVIVYTDSINTTTHVNNIVDPKITTEKNARVAADSDEMVARIAGDKLVQDNLDNEATARKNADSDEMATRIANDNTLQSNIDNEATARTAAVSTLNEKIQVVVDNRITADTTLQTNIDNEATARKNADSDLCDKIKAGDALNDSDIKVLRADLDARAPNDYTAQGIIRSRKHWNFSHDQFLFMSGINPNATDKVRLLLEDGVISAERSDPAVNDWSPFVAKKGGDIVNKKYLEDNSSNCIVSTTEPTDALDTQEGNMWFNPNNNVLKIYVAD